MAGSTTDWVQGAWPGTSENKDSMANFIHIWAVHTPFNGDSSNISCSETELVYGDWHPTENYILGPPFLFREVWRMASID